ncbi:hypothetical protein [Candidatus Accumulibacter sp. ACC007]|uniref:hypothetical protein n=1 Tax=Candidatus Accumulibacter sp. ACC007 TaxID=2823333 RepID=UPI0025B9FE88|nr:hypothetical protein [Candidatus Accumulibacter sp. ACC007]
MADDEDLLDRANSLINADAGARRDEQTNSARPMRRRRSFLASADSDHVDGSRRFGHRGSEDDDLPLLTDVVVAVEAEPETSVDDIAANLRPTLAAEFAELIDRHLAAALPALVEAATAEAAENLRHGIEASIATAASDFIAQRGQLQLPLEEPASGEAKQEQK